MCLEQNQPLKRNLPYFRWECMAGIRPCPYISCRYHAFDVLPMIHRLTDEKILEKLENLTDSCILDVIEINGNLNLREIGSFFGFSRQRAAQLFSDCFVERVYEKIRLRIG